MPYLKGDVASLLGEAVSRRGDDLAGEGLPLLLLMMLLLLLVNVALLIRLISPTTLQERYSKDILALYARG